MQQIYYSQTTDQEYDVEIYTDNIFVYCFIGKWLVYVSYDTDQTFETLDYTYYLGVIDCLYEQQR